MFGINEEICESRVREICRPEQAYVINDSIGCRECNEALGDSKDLQLSIWLRSCTDSPETGTARESSKNLMEKAICEIISLNSLDGMTLTEGATVADYCLAKPWINTKYRGVVRLLLFLRSSLVQRNLCNFTS